MSMNDTNIENKIKKLRLDLNYYNYQYYVLNTSKISDYEYDKMINELIVLELDNPQLFSKFSPTNRVGSDLISHFKSVKHIYPMLSLSNTYSRKDLITFGVSRELLSLESSQRTYPNASAQVIL